MTELYIGLISGTSADGIDAALVDFSHAQPKVVATHYTPYSPALREQVLALNKPSDNEIQRLGELDITLGKAFAEAAQALIKKHPGQPVHAIGSHGQNIRHHPHAPYHFTLQIGDPNTIAAETGITTVADFRRKDVALGGQGAPLVPAFHQHILASPTSDRAIVNIGGIANITLLAKNATAAIIGFDTGPGNALMDEWIATHQQSTHDQHGAWGAQGSVDVELLNAMLTDAYFQRSAPKSTGREYFNAAWLQKQLAAFKNTIAPVDVQTTLVELTAQTIVNDIRRAFVSGEIIVCGGGVHNRFLMQRLQVLAGKDFTVASTQQYGVDPDWVEAMAFAWLAKQTLNRAPGNLPSVTGAKEATILGGVYFA